MSVLSVCRTCSSAFHEAHSCPPLFPRSAVPSNFLRLVLCTEAGVSAFPQHMYADFLQLLPISCESNSSEPWPWGWWLRWGQEEKSQLGFAGCDRTFSALTDLHEGGGKSGPSRAVLLQEDKARKLARWDI